jgi:hypothetical protein
VAPSSRPMMTMSIANESVDYGCQALSLGHCRPAKKPSRVIPIPGPIRGRG